MTKIELINLITNNPSNFSQVLKRLDEPLFNEIDKLYNYNSFSQKLYDYIHNPNKTCIACNNTTKYLGINNGYSETCSNKCKGTIRSSKSIETRSCVICDGKFEIYKIRQKTTCSPKCLQLLNNSDSVKKKRVDSHKKTIKDKYGVEWYSQTDAFKDKLHQHHTSGTFDYNAIAKKVKKTKLKKYGDENYNNIEKAKATFLEKYGVTNYSHTIQFKKMHYERVIGKIPSTLRLIENFTEYNDVLAGLYSFECTECDTKFASTLNNGAIPICRVCNPTMWNSSNFEDEILDYIKSMQIDNLVTSDRTIIKPKELDIVITDMNIAIECNGNYWHSELSGKKDKNYHLNKTTDCFNAGVRLIHIFEDEWQRKKDIVKHRLRNILGKNNTRIYGRDCTISEISTDVKQEFLNKTHIQGTDKSQIKLGIFHKTELVGVMTFSKRKIFGNIDWELVRFSTIYNVIGGASKLFKYFVKNYNPTKVITYSDIRWNTGGVYLKMGFDKIGQSSPGYFYLKGGVRYNRMNFQKHKLKDKLEKFEENLTEWENMQINGYDRIWDCGHYKYEWSSK